MKDSTTVLSDDLKIHFIRKLHGGRHEIFDIYELRKNFGLGHLKTIKRVAVPHGSDMATLRAKIAATKEEDAYDTLIRELLPSSLAENQICFQGDDLVQLAINELGLDEVRDISRPSYLAMWKIRNYWESVNFSHHYEDHIGAEVAECKELLFNALRVRLGDVYVADKSKDHLREYVNQKFFADLGL